MPTNITLDPLYRNPVTGWLESGYVPMPDELRYAVGYYAPQVMPFTLVRPAPASEVIGFYSLDHYGYVGRETQIPIVAQGGAFPHSVVIDEAPAGATISNTPWDDDYLVLKFTPTANGTYKIRLRLYDAVGMLIVISYTFTVSENWCVFVSPSGNDSTGNGTKSNPWKTYAKAFSTATGGKCLILEDGTYDETTMGSSFSNSTIGSMCAWNQRGAIIDKLAVNSTGTSAVFITNKSHFAVQGLVFNNPPDSVSNPRWFSGDNSSQYLHMDNCEFDVDGRSGTANDDNVSCWMLGGDTNTDRRFLSQTRCNFTGFVGLNNGWSSIDLYATSNCVIRSNKFSDQISTTTIAGMVWVKGSNNKNIDIQLNEFETVFGGNVIDIYLGNIVDADDKSGNIDVSFNLFRGSGVTGIMFARASQSGRRLPVWTRRNTLIGGCIMVFDRTYGVTISSDSDVIQSTDSSTDPWKVLLRKDGAFKPLSGMSSLTYSVTNYECQDNSGVVDSDGILIDGYSQYRGIRGHEIMRGPQ